MLYRNTNRDAVVYLMGGLGNNLFQLNLAYALKETGANVVINVGLLLGRGYVAKLLGWTDHKSYDSLIDLDLLRGFTVVEEVSVLVLLFGFLSKITQRTILNIGFYGLNNPSRIDGQGGHFFGYYHNIKEVNKLLALHVRKELIRILQTREYIWSDIIFVRRGAPVVHVRGGDFFSDSKNMLNCDYYHDALKKLSQFSAVDCIVATNDKTYAKKILGLKNIRFTASRDAIDDFIIICESKYKILSNSTFAWWAAELGDADTKIIEITPYYVELDWRPQSMHNRILIPRS